MADISPAPSNPPQTGTKPVIVARGVRKHYGSIHAVDGVNLEVQEGELFGLIGHNGAGKSTMFKMMLGLIPVTSGEIRIDGAPGESDACHCGQCHRQSGHDVASVNVPQGASSGERRGAHHLVPFLRTRAPRLLFGLRLGPVPAPAAGPPSRKRVARKSSNSG